MFSLCLPVRYLRHELDELPHLHGSEQINDNSHLCLQLGILRHWCYSMFSLFISVRNLCDELDELPHLHGYE